MKTTIETEDVKELVESYKSLSDKERRRALHDMKIRAAIPLARKLSRRKTRPMSDAEIMKVIKDIRKKKGNG
jgi:hypothetical protein